MLILVCRSSTQIAIFVLPLLVVIGWMMDKPLSLDFHLFETASIFISVVIVSILIQKGKSNWLSGLMLLVAYFIVSAAYFVHKSEVEGAAICRGVVVLLLLLLLVVVVVCDLAWWHYNLCDYRRWRGIDV